MPTASAQSPALHAPSRLERIAEKLVTAFSYVILFAGICTVILTAALVLISYTPMPFLDQWMMIDLFAHQKGTISFSALWLQHNEHRMIFPKLFYLADLYLAGGRNILLLASIFLTQLAHWALWGYIFRRNAGFSGSAWRTAFGIAGYCLFCPGQYENFVWPFQIGFVLPPLAVTIALLALWQYANQVQSGAGKAAPLKGLLVALVAAVIGTYSLANGVLIWPLLVFGAIVFRLPARTTLLLCLVGLLSVALYFIGYTSSTEIRDFLRSHLLDGLNFVLHYFATSFKYLSLGLFYALAGCVLAVVTILSVRLLLKRQRNSFVFLPVGVILFCSGTAALTAVGRMYQGIVSRYQTIAMLFWLCAALLLLCWLWKPVSEKEPDPFARLAFQTSALVIMVLVIPTVSDLQRYLVIRRQNQETATLAMVVGVPDISFSDILLPDEYFVSKHFDVESDLQFLRSLHAWIYADKFYASYGSKVESIYQPASKDECSGALESVRLIGNELQRGARVTGWAWDRNTNQPVSKIVIITPDGLISGLARGKEYGLPRHTSITHPRTTTWRGFVHGMPHPVPIRAYAIVGDHLACPLETGDAVPPEFSGDGISPTSEAAEH